MDFFSDNWNELTDSVDGDWGIWLIRVGADDDFYVNVNIN